MTITTRAGKGSSLTNEEMDSNLYSLDNRGGSTLASSSIVSLTDEYNSFAISGTTTITGLTKAGVVAGYIVRFYFLDTGGALTQNLTSLQLPGEKDIIWKAGDRATFINDGGDNWRCIDYTVNSLAPYGRTLLKVKTANGTATSDNTLSADSDLVFTNLDPGIYRIEMYLYVGQVGAATPEFKYQLAVVGTTAYLANFSQFPLTGTPNQKCGSVAATQTTALGSVTYGLHLLGTVQVTAATNSITLTWAQSVNSTIPTRLYVGSWMSVLRDNN